MVREVIVRDGWRFHMEEPGHVFSADGIEAAESFDDRSWQDVCLPHSVKIEAPTHAAAYYRGICWYRRVIKVDPSWSGRCVSVVFDGAMQKAEVWINGKSVMTHVGGYLPFVVELTSHMQGQKCITLAVRLDNRSSDQFPPGKDDVDFTFHGGLYRSVRLVVTDPVHITDPIRADRVAGGGVFFRYEDVSSASARVLAQAHVHNEGSESVPVAVHFTVCGPDGDVAAEASAALIQMKPGSTADFPATLSMKNPVLWHPDNPNLYTVTTTVLKNGMVCDEHQTRIGIRHLAYTDDGFILNGGKLMIRGANRHMNFPWLGNAGSDAMQYRDLRLLKDAGFNFVRLCHYPQSTATMDACDELGLMALVCTPGWQCYHNNEAFRNAAYRNIREMIRWHRNHPSAVLWEVSLNETPGHDDFYAECTAIAHEEYPGDQLFTSGDSCGCKKVQHYDVTYTGWPEFYQRPLHPEARIRKGLHREYGDYEFGGQQSTTRVPRGGGEEKLMLQAWNFQWSHNTNLSWPWTLGDAIWCGIDCLSSYDRPAKGECSWWGPLDLYRLPKFSYYFYQSQRSPDISAKTYDAGPMVHIAGYWTPRSSPVKVVVYSNCDEVELVLNGRKVGRQKPDHGPDSEYGAYRKDADPMYWTKKMESFEATEKGKEDAANKATAIFDGGNANHIAHPPFTFVPVPYEQGELKAVAYRKGKAVAEHVLNTPDMPACIRLSAPESGKSWQADGSDTLFVYASVTDAKGVVVPDAVNNIRFTVKGMAKLITPVELSAEAGIASAMVQSVSNSGEVRISADSKGLSSDEIVLHAQ